MVKRSPRIYCLPTNTIAILFIEGKINGKKLQPVCRQAEYAPPHEADFCMRLSVYVSFWCQDVSSIWLCYVDLKQYTNTQVYVHSKVSFLTEPFCISFVFVILRCAKTQLWKNITWKGTIWSGSPRFREKHILVILLMVQESRHIL